MIENAEKKIKNLNQCACYVLLTCSAPDENGKMQVEMQYEGDETLASFLVENATQVFNEQGAERESQ